MVFIRGQYPLAICLAPYTPILQFSMNIRLIKIPKNNCLRLDMSVLIKYLTPVQQIILFAVQLRQIYIDLGILDFETKETMTNI